MLTAVDNVFESFFPKKYTKEGIKEGSAGTPIQPSGAIPSKDREDEGFSPNTKMIVSILKEINQVKDLEGISDIIESAIQAIKVQKMSKQVKRNRINFFATQRS